MAAIAQDQLRPLRRSEYDQLVALGAFEGENIELVHGALVQMNPPRPPHCSSVDKLNLLLVRALSDRALVRIQSPFAASDLSEPQPDVAVVPLGEYSLDHPTTAHLIIEVAASSLALDRGVKLRLYAEAGVPEYWIVNLVERTIEAHASPRDGAYTEMSVHRPGETLQLRHFPDVAVRVDDVLPTSAPPSRSPPAR